MRPELIVYLRLLRRRLFRQLQFVRQGRMPEALTLDEVLGQMLREVQALEVTTPAPVTGTARLKEQCAELVDRIHPYLTHEVRLLSREWITLQVEQELTRLAAEPVLSDRVERRTAIL